MIFDSLDLMNPRAKFTATGKFYAMRPDADPSGIVFNYEYVNPYSSTYKRLFSNIQGEASNVVIRTNDLIKPVENRNYMLLADGRLFRVAQIEIDYQSASKQALRLFGTPLGTTLVLRLVEEENKWGVR